MLPTSDPVHVRLLEKAASQIPALVCLAVLTWFGLNGLKELQAGYMERLKARDIEFKELTITFREQSAAVVSALKESSAVIAKNTRVMETLTNEAFTRSRTVE